MVDPLECGASGERNEVIGNMPLKGLLGPRLLFISGTQRVG